MKIRVIRPKNWEKMRVSYAKLKYITRYSSGGSNFIEMVEMVENSLDRYPGTSVPLRGLPKIKQLPKFKKGLVFVVKYVRRKDCEGTSDSNCAVPYYWESYDREWVKVEKRAERRIK